MEIFIILNFILSGIALWYRHDDNKTRRIKDALGELKYAAPETHHGVWLCRSNLYPLLTGEGHTSSEAREDLYKKYKKFERNLKEYQNGKR